MADGGIAVMQWPREEKGSLEDIGWLGTYDRRVSGMYSRFSISFV